MLFLCCTSQCCMQIAQPHYQITRSSEVQIPLYSCAVANWQCRETLSFLLNKHI